MPKFVRNLSVYRDLFAINPLVFLIGINAGLLFTIVAIGFGWMALFNVVSIKMYGDHCKFDEDCATDMNYICQNGKCSCVSATFFLSASSGCGMYFIILVQGLGNICF